MALAERAVRSALTGRVNPRIAPPIPAKSLLKEYEVAAKSLGIDLMPWQRVAARYMTALGPREKWLYREVCYVVARQNGKTELLLPRIRLGLSKGRRMLHTAQNRAIPRETFLRIAEVLAGDPDLKEIRYANGQEVIKWANGGRYTLVAPRPGVRGNSTDDVFLDEVREQHTNELIAGIKPTMTASRNPQIIYLSNAGDSDSLVLNDLRRRAASDPSLAYLEWSAAPERKLDDREGWRESNPSLGITIQPETLAAFYESYRDSDPATWETEHLCRWVATMRQTLVSDGAWMLCRDKLETSLRPGMAINMDPSGKRASAVIAWQQSDGTVAVRVVADVTGDPIDTDRLGKDLSQLAIRTGATAVSFGAWTDADLARHFRKAKSLDGREFANASENFVRLVESRRLRWDDATIIGEDLAWTARKPHESGAWMAVKATDDRPATAALAAIRAVWLASGPRPAAPRVM